MKWPGGCARSGSNRARIRSTVLVVSHVTPIKLLVRSALDAPMAALFRMELDPASITRVSWWEDGNASLRAFNDTSHLREQKP